MQKLPEDVENVLEGYDYANNTDDMKLEISGKKIIRRGRRILGLRSNLAKTNFFEDIRGTLRTKTGKLKFSASDAEWSGIRSQPFILKKNVSVILDGKSLKEVNSAKIYFGQGVLEVNNGSKTLYRLK